MTKQKNMYICMVCGKKYQKWHGQCENCESWNTLEEKDTMAIGIQQAPAKLLHRVKNIPSLLSAPVAPDSSYIDKKIPTAIGEFDRVIGKGFFPGSVTLLTGDPGVGKSTLCLHVLLSIAHQLPKKKVILVSGEESLSQISDRLHRISPTPPPNLLLLCEGIWENIVNSLPIKEIGFLLFDSVQTIATIEVASGSGSLAQSTAIVERIMMIAKTENIPCLIIGHVTKTGEMAGPQTMAHLVDTVLHLESEGYSEYRMLRSKKNRFGSVLEMGIFEMKENGMAEVINPSQHFLSGRLLGAIGSAIFPSVEGSRSYLMEIQALTKYTSFGYPKRSTSGFDANRLSILLAVIARFTSTKLENEDVFVNIAGGLKTTEPAADAAVVAAIIAAKKKISLPQKAVFLGEIGLSGEIRHIPNIEKRLLEAKKLGFNLAFIPSFSIHSDTYKIMSLKAVNTVLELEECLETHV